MKALAGILMLGALLAAAAPPAASGGAGASPAPAGTQNEGGDAGKVRKIRARVQPRPGAKIAEVEMQVHPVPTDVASVGAAEAAFLEDTDLVLGVVVDGAAMAYPVRFLAMYEIVDDRVGRTPVAPSW